MYGLVNAAVQDLVVSKFGTDKWEKIKTKVGWDGDSFSRMAQYPDDLTYKFVGAASEVLSITPDQVLEAFGEYWVLYTGQEGYGHMFDIAGSTLREFLINLDSLHTRVGQNFANLKPPSFTYDEVNEQTLRMHYHSDRKGLCPMVSGLLRGLSKRFETELRIDHPVCSRLGAPHCEFMLTVSGGNA